jgi:solute:Na+ symporter, SSS family
MTFYDDAVLVFYFVFMAAITWVFRRFVHTVSDYFRGGGKALWWMVGGSAFMVSFSAWTFTGAASAAYSDGWPIAVIYLSNVVGFLLAAAYFAPRLRQLRVVTGVEAIRLRFGRGSEQVFAWLQIPLGTLQAGIWLNALSVFFSAVFGYDLTLTIVVTGLIVVFMALLGGSWAVLASDFIQVLILMPVCAAVTILALMRVGGIEGFVTALPPQHLDVNRIFSQEFLGLWCVAMLLKQINTANNLLEGSRYLCVKDSRQARWAALLGAGLFLIGIVIWFVPPMVARIVFPDIQGMFPHLNNASEASFIAIAREVLPVGMVGLLVSGIFAATMSSMDAGLNKNAGIFIKNVYQPYFTKNGSDGHLLKVGKYTTLALGAVVILVGLKMSQLKDLGLFLLMQRVSILVATPIIVPLILGILVRRTPPWAGWSTVLIGFLCSLAVGDYLTPEWAVEVFGVGAPVVDATREYWMQGIQVFVTVAVGTAWFLGTRLFYHTSTVTQRERIETFFERLDRPVDFEKEEGERAANDARQSRAIGWLCLAYGCFVAALSLIPNPLSGRLAFIGCGGLALLIGAVLVWRAKKISRVVVPAGQSSPWAHAQGYQTPVR